MAVSAVDEINSGMVGNIVSPSGVPAGILKVQSGPALDLWQWDTPSFPNGGFSVQCTGSSGPCSPTVVYTAYTFDKDTCTAFEHWPGENQVFKLQKNGTLVGWVEMQFGDKPDMMWWSNGVDLNSNREITLGVGDELSFINDKLPDMSLYPLTSVQTPV